MSLIRSLGSSSSLFGPHLMALTFPSSNRVLWVSDELLAVGGLNGGVHLIEFVAAPTVVASISPDVRPLHAIPCESYLISL